ncbi:DUF3426 domain-containing protein [Luteimonas sp. RD2P54]|uniref:DUF3426 domain-containing protein n=1 Tax=Luteimonas endophytica TaxID=3042023 RepID=A0ABT6JDN4_9GAMM|nr:DUF3426 domain-containing protein [Luteimonas endophytica]MDH5824901.1 DUF3426 domain-containing protein [Luteimonas endophytica]
MDDPGRAPERPDPPPPAAEAPRAVAHGRPAPSFAQRRRHAGQAVRHRWPALAAIAALASLLALQLLLADRERLAADPQWRPLLARLCGTLGCALPPWREPQAIALLHRDVRPHPQRPGVLRVSATIRNDARWTQAWPQLQLRLTDVDGRPLGERRFLAHEYLAAAPASGGMSSGQRATIRMDVLEPSPHTVAFDFEFH